jgi:hypothetical protein
MPLSLLQALASNPDGNLETLLLAEHSFTKPDAWRRSCRFHRVPTLGIDLKLNGRVLAVA